MKRGGFTLIELLIVIAIIGILASLIVSMVSTSRNRAYDTHRKNNARNIMSAVMQYKSDTNIYPQALTGSTLDDLKNSGKLAPYIGNSAFSRYYLDLATNARYSTYLWYNNQPTTGMAMAWVLAYQGEPSLAVSPAKLNQLNTYGVYQAAVYGSFQLINNDNTPFVDLVMNSPEDPYHAPFPNNAKVYATWGL